MRVIAWTIASVLIATFVIETAFVYLATAKRVLATGALWKEFRVVAYIWLPLGYAGDIVFNLTRGTWTFREFPKELLFSSRVQRHVRGSGWRQKRALEWAAILNAIDPDHIKL